MGLTLRYLVSAVCLIFLAGTVHNTVRCESPPASYPPDRAFIQRLKAAMPALDLSQEPRPLSTDAQTFYRAYGLYHDQVQNFFGAFESDSYKIAAYVLSPKFARGTVFCIHGYFDHFGILQHLVRSCLAQHYAVAGFDLPGHGLSSGEPNTIDDFDDYVSVLDEFIRRCGEKLPQPYYLVSHSTGAAVTLEFMFTRPLQADRFKGFVLAAPLVRHSYYKLTRAQLFLLRPFCRSLPRWLRANSGDADFVERLKQDPLQGRRVPIRWLDALHQWNDRFVGYGPCARPVLIVQGTADGVVDWRYNMALLAEKMTAGRTVLIEGAKHQLFNETAPLRGQVLREVLAFMEQ